MATASPTSSCRFRSSRKQCSVGSMGKQFTATAVMMLVEEGKVGLEDPLTKYSRRHQRRKNVTVRQLLSHTGGVHRLSGKFDFRRDRTENEL